MNLVTIRTLVLGCALALTFGGCGKGESGSSAGATASGSGAAIEGKVRVDGSSTVYPISEAVAEEFQKGKKVRILVGKSGTGGGMKKFCAGEIDVTGASRYIKKSEKELCAKNGVEFVELPVAYDGISVVVHKDNTFVDHLSVSELKKLWAPEAQGKVVTWNQVRDSFPATKITLYGPGTDSGTFDYFTKKVVGKTQASRGDYTASEDDNVLVTGVSKGTGALGYFGFAYYIENKDKLRAVPVKHGDKTPVSPTLETISDQSYAPLSRPIFIYVSKKAAERPEVDAFIKFYLGDGSPLAKDVGYIPLPAKVAVEANKRYGDRVTGSVKN